MLREGLRVDPLHLVLERNAVCGHREPPDPAGVGEMAVLDDSPRSATINGVEVVGARLGRAGFRPAARRQDPLPRSVTARSLPARSAINRSSDPVPAGTGSAEPSEDRRIRRGPLGWLLRPGPRR